MNKLIVCGDSMKKILIITFFVLIGIIVAFKKVKDEYCFKYKKINLENIDNFRLKFGYELVESTAWHIYKPPIDSIYDKGYVSVYISKYNIKNENILMDLIKKSDPNKSFIDNFGVIAGFDKGNIFFYNNKIILPKKSIKEQKDAYEKIDRSIFNILRSYIDSNYTYIIVSRSSDESADFIPFSSFKIRSSKAVPLNEKKMIFKNYSGADSIYKNQFKYLMTFNKYSIHEPLLCCDKKSIDEKLKLNFEKFREESTQKNYNKIKYFFDYGVDLNTLDGRENLDSLYFNENFANYNHYFLNKNEISISGKYRAIVEMQHSYSLGISNLAGQVVNSCNF
ncbi:Uncharacterised protein [Acinetobacter baumannii]|nr:Uncharacterised protein [Acinetobacter baumannii]SSV56835.1 Uncharacterised protein [Acinetobacter baumannii]SSV60905.1 Uncharacterised protein [Acinetobacter baumannii]SSV88091.1 Uncharacterised protein [Acinetobacter baumannii]